MHILGRSSAVFRSVITAAELVHHIPECAEQSVPIKRAPRLNDDGFPPSVIKPGQCCFIGHAFGEPKRIMQRRVIIRINRQAAAAKSRAEQRAVNGNDCIQMACGIVADENLTIAQVSHVV